MLGTWWGPDRAPWEGTGWGHCSLRAGTQCGGGLSALEDGPGILFAHCCIPDLLAGSLEQPTHRLAWPQPGAVDLPRRDPEVWGAPRGCSRAGVGTVIQAPCAGQRWPGAWGLWDCVAGGPGKGSEGWYPETP